ncbi:unnamed protein product, partial [marine sediment metagenome]
MPHKRNPILSERICGLARLVRSNAQASLENIPLWGERDISHSSVERAIIPDSTILVDYMLEKFIQILDALSVYKENMKANLEMTGGLVFSEGILLELVKKGVSREDAYRMVQRNAMKTWQENREEFCHDYVFPALKAGALYEERYPLATALARPLITKGLVEIAEQEGAEAIAHGCTGKGNDQVRFELTAKALDPDLIILAPVREWEL